MRGLGELPALRELILNNNAIARIEGLEGCRRLERLWLFSNRIERVENLSPLGDLTELWLQDNGIEALIGAGLEGLVNLRQLYLAGNPIENQRELEALTYLPSLVDLSFADRFFWPAPVADSEGYRQLVITHLRQVVVLDGFDILPEERMEVEDNHLRAALEFNDSIEDLRRRHRAHANELEALREKNLEAARGVRGRLAVKLRQLEQLVQDSRGQVLGAVEAAARRRESARAELRQRLTVIGKEHARCVERMMASYENEARAEEAFFRRRRRRAKFQREEAEAYLTLGYRSGGREEEEEEEEEKRERSGDGGGGGGTTGASGVYELVEGGVEMQQVRQELSAAAGAAGELPPKAAAAAAAAIAAAAAAERKAQASGESHAADAVNQSASAPAFESISTGTVLTLGAYRIVDAASSSTFQRSVEAAIDLGAMGGQRRVLKWAFLGVTPAAARAVLTRGLATAASCGELGGAAVFGGGEVIDGGGGGDGGDGFAGGVECSVRLHRSAGGAYEAAQLAMAATASRDSTAGSWSGSAGNDDGGLDEGGGGPAAIIMCQVLADPSAAAAWERVAPRRKSGGASAVDPVLSALFSVADICPQYVLHLERAPPPPPKGGAAADPGGAPGVSAGFHPAELAGGNLSIQAHVMDLLEAPTVSPRDAAELRALEDRVEAEVRQYRYDLWHEMDADVAASVEEQDRELEDMRRELEEVREAITAERESQDQIIRSFRETSAHLHRLRDDRRDDRNDHHSHHYHHYRGRVGGGGGDDRGAPPGGVDVIRASNTRSSAMRGGGSTGYTFGKQSGGGGGGGGGAIMSSFGRSSSSGVGGPSTPPKGALRRSRGGGGARSGVGTAW